MDKQEYKASIEMMKTHAAAGQYTEAAELCDGINWRKVNNVNNLVEASDVYEAAGNDQAAIDLLLIAHERSPVGRTIIYKLAMLYLKKGDIETARIFHQKFVEIAPKDSLKYILKYNILVAGNAEEDAIIKVLEQLKEADFMEEWGYELAYRYHKTGHIEECVDLCDELILWFGEGPYVERALELKMIYTPLDKVQEDKYRHFQQRKEGITEIRANEELQSGEIVSHTVTIPSIEIKQERFNTVNLQAEIKKNIDEIMKATEAGEVCENMDAIKSLVEDIPYLQVAAPEEEKPAVEDEKEKPSINDVFKDYLKEEYDGQLSFLIPEDEEKGDSKDEDTEGQMSIDEVLSEWERTRHAAEMALEDARRQELEEVKAKALREATFVLNRLEEAMPKLDAGVSPNELLKEEYLAGGNIVTKVELPKAKEEFSFPKLDSEGNVSGEMSVPVVHVEEEKGKILPSQEESKAVQRGTSLLSTATWNPPVLTNPVNAVTAGVNKAENEMKSATSMLADVNNMLQKEIDKVGAGLIPDIKIPDVDTVSEDAAKESIDLSAIARIMNESMQQTAVEKIVKDAKAEMAEEKDEGIDFEEVNFEEISIEELNSEESESKEGVFIPEIKLEESDPVLPEIISEKSESELPEIRIEEPKLNLPETQIEESEVNLPDIQIEEPEVELPEIQIEEPEVNLPEIQIEEPEVKLPEIQIEEPESELPEVKEEINEETSESFDIPSIALTPDDKKIFTYFMQLKGMEGHISKVLSGCVAAMKNNAISRQGNIIIMGDSGTGKTKLATSFVKSVQLHTGKINGAIGKIDGQKLNEKNMTDLFSKISGGSLIIENASGMDRKTAGELSLSMGSDRAGTLVIFEDSEDGINKLLHLEPTFINLFTEKISIPVFSIDELVEFGRTYAMDQNCVLDEMAVMELYSRIDDITRFDHPTTISEVAEIMEDAIDNATRGGFFKKKAKTDKDGRYIIKEKHFED